MKLLFFTLTFVLSRVVAADSVVPGIEERSEFSFSSIIITTPQTIAPSLQDEGAPGGASSQRVDPHSQSHAELVLPKPMRKYQAEVDSTEPFGYGSLFVYNVREDFGDIAIPFTHRNILKRLKDYKENEHREGKYKDSNLLLIRVRFTCISHERSHSFECYFGLFSSGVAKKYDCKTISQIYAGPQFSTLSEPLKKEFVGRLLLENKLLHEYCKLDVAQALTGVDCDADVYTYKLFKLDGHTLKRVIFSNIDYVVSTGGFNKNLLQKVLKKLWAESGEGVNDEEVKKYFDCVRTDLFGSDDKLGPYFNQSEQAFFNSLETDDVGAFFGSNPLPVDEDTQIAEGGTMASMEPGSEAFDEESAATYSASSHAYNVRVDMYSYRDICVICRGCIARLLENGWLADNIQKTIRTKSGNNTFAINSIKEVYAHSIISTDVHIEKRHGTA